MTTDELLIAAGLKCPCGSESAPEACWRCAIGTIFQVTPSRITFANDPDVGFYRVPATSILTITDGS